MSSSQTQKVLNGENWKSLTDQLNVKDRKPRPSETSQYNHLKPPFLKIKKKNSEMERS